MINLSNFNLETEIDKIKCINQKDERKNSDIYYYSTDKIIRLLYDISLDIPLNVYTYHGINLRDYETGCETAFKTDVPVLVTRQSQEIYLRDREKKAFTVGSLFVNYRRQKKIERSPNAKGTLVFPSHSTEFIDVLMNWDEYAEQLCHLPTELQPVAVCMYWKDLLAGVHASFEKRGIKVFTAGHYADIDFVDNFYEILRNFKYSSGNTVGSHAFYSVEMGIPYFILGSEPNFYNSGDPNRKMGEYSYNVLENKDITDSFPRYSSQIEDIRITPRLSNFVEKMLGIEGQTEKSQIRTEIIAAAKQHNVNLFNEMFDHVTDLLPTLLGKQVVIFGAGKTGQILGSILNGFSIQDYYFVDNDSSKWETMLCGKCVRKPDGLLNEDKGLLTVLVGSVYYDEIVNQLEKYGLILGRHFHRVLSFSLTDTQSLIVKEHKLERAQLIGTHLTEKEKFKLFDLARVKKNGVCVEIGSYLGCSSSFIAAAIGSGGKLFCVDTWQNETMPEGTRDTFSEFMDNTQPFKDTIIPLRGTSVEMAASFDGAIDFLFVNADHSYESVKADVDAWFPKLKSDAIVVFHDMGWAEGVQRVVAEYVSPIVVSEGRLPNLYWAWF